MIIFLISILLGGCSHLKDPGQAPSINEKTSESITPDPPPRAQKSRKARVGYLCEGEFVTEAARTSLGDYNCSQTRVTLPTGRMKLFPNTNGMVLFHKHYPGFVTLKSHFPGGEGNTYLIDLFNQNDMFYAGKNDPVFSPDKTKFFIAEAGDNLVCESFRIFSYREKLKEEFNLIVSNDCQADCKEKLNCAETPVKDKGLREIQWLNNTTIVGKLCTNPRWEPKCQDIQIVFDSSQKWIPSFPVMFSQKK